MSAHLRSRLAELDAQICEQRRALGKLEQTRSDVERELHAIATFPVSTLPTEITAEIFLSCLVIFDPFSIPHYRTPLPILLTSVCRAWRDIALITPMLWSTLRVQFDRISGSVASNSGFIEGFIDQWLTCAGNLPLSLDFESRRKVFTLNRLRGIIHRWSHRVQHIHLNLGWCSDPSPLGLDSVEFPLLQGATLTIDAEANAPIIVFSNAPQLHQFCLLSNSLAPNTFTLAWSQLTKFEGSLWDLALFALAPNLTEMTCRFNDPDEDIAITHRSLESLTILGEHSTVDLMRYLTLPALRCLVVSEPTDYHSLESFLTRSSPPLISLSVTRSRSFDHLRQCLPLVGGTLESLEVSKVSGDDIDNVLTWFNKHILPNMHTLSFRDHQGLCDFQELVNFLYARSNKLRTFGIVWKSNPFLGRIVRAGRPHNKSGHDIIDYHMRDTVKNHISHLAQQGMDIYLGTADTNFVGDPLSDVRSARTISFS
ncbi:hypothetical protein K438DRAFT_2009070 [Mycena galopus ATCC 62051]|nr:hypothetical protein K438DRAFT_2009070 [Mycena galopus ATCC 62051]